jgi:hypothetical protein
VGLYLGNRYTYQPDPGSFECIFQGEHGKIVRELPFSIVLKIWTIQVTTKNGGTGKVQTAPRLVPMILFLV